MNYLIQSFHEHANKLAAGRRLWRPTGRDANGRLLWSSFEPTPKEVAAVRNAAYKGRRDAE